MVEGHMAPMEASINHLPLSNAGDPQSMSAALPSEPASSVTESTLETNENMEQKARTLTRTDPPIQNSIKQNCSIQSSSLSSSPRSSVFLSRFNSPKLLSASLPHHSSACCHFQESECCNLKQQDESLFQGSLHSRALHMGPCCVQGTPRFCMQQQWQERFQNQPNMTTFR
ncbi:protein dispatched homolog 1 isoform X1 [Tachysurus ichikawai]